MTAVIHSLHSSSPSYSKWLGNQPKGSWWWLKRQAVTIAEWVSSYRAKKRQWVQPYMGDCKETVSGWASTRDPDKIKVKQAKKERSMKANSKIPQRMTVAASQGKVTYWKHSHQNVLPLLLLNFPWLFPWRAQFSGNPFWSYFKYKHFSFKSFLYIFLLLFLLVAKNSPCVWPGKALAEISFLNATTEELEHELPAPKPFFLLI